MYVRICFKPLLLLMTQYAYFNIIFSSSNVWGFSFMEKSSISYKFKESRLKWDINVKSCLLSNFVFVFECVSLSGSKTLFFDRFCFHRRACVCLCVCMYESLYSFLKTFMATFDKKPFWWFFGNYFSFIGEAKCSEPYRKHLMNRCVFYWKHQSRFTLYSVNASFHFPTNLWLLETVFFFLHIRFFRVRNFLS